MGFHRVKSWLFWFNEIEMGATTQLMLQFGTLRCIESMNYETSMLTVVGVFAMSSCAKAVGSLTSSELSRLLAQ